MSSSSAYNEESPVHKWSPRFLLGSGVDRTSKSDYFVDGASVPRVTEIELSKVSATGNVFGENRVCAILSPGANPTIASYNASVAKIYSATNSMARCQKKYYFSPM
jgi:hypothetical protein